MNFLNLKISTKGRRICVLSLLGMALGTFTHQGFARPQYFERYRAYPFARPELKTCGVCHIDPKGGGPRNEFGMAFANEGRQFTAALRTQFPDRFLQDRANLGNGVQIIFEGGEGGTIIVRQGKNSYRVTPGSKDVEKIAEAAAAAGPGLTTPAASLPESRGGSPTFDYQVVNVRTGKIVPKGELYFRFTHRFTAPLFSRKACEFCDSRRHFDLFGLDSYNYPGIGVGYGLTNRLAINVFRDRGLGIGMSNRDLEFSGDLSILEQGESRSPISLMARGAVHGKNDFASQGHNGHYLPSFQLVLSRTFGNRFSLNVDPTFVFNLQGPDSTAIDDRLVAIGLGGSIKLRENMAIVGEFIPRVTGRPFGRRYIYEEPTASFGLQYRTNRHVFELIFTNAWQTTMAGSALGGPDGKHIGFNLYRRIK